MSLPPQNDNDDHFLSLLSSQRKILKRLNIKKANNMITSSSKKVLQPIYYSIRPYSNQAPRHNSTYTNNIQRMNASNLFPPNRKYASDFVGVMDQILSMNQSIKKFHPCCDGSFLTLKNQKMMPLRKGNDKLVTEKISSHQRYFGMYAAYKKSPERKDSLELLTNALLCEEDLPTIPRTTKHLDFHHFSSSILYYRKNIRDSISSLSYDQKLKTKNIIQNAEKDHSEFSRKTYHRNIQQQKTLDPTITISSPFTKGSFHYFLLAMDNSADSQQQIHDWDRKMGLKRSHSKTMRLSMQSRKKLKSLIKEKKKKLGNYKTYPLPPFTLLNDIC